MTKYFSSIALHPLSERPETILFVREAGAPPLTPDARLFKRTVFEGLDVIDLVIAPSNDERKKLFELYEQAAKAGLGGDDPTLDDGYDKLYAAQRRVVYYANSRVIRRFIIGLCTLGAACIVIGYMAVLWLGNFIVSKLTLSDISKDNLLHLTEGISYSVVGIGVSMFFLAFVRNRSMTYANISIRTQEDFSIWRQFGYVISVTAVIIMVLGFDVIVIGVGNLQLNQFDTNPPLGMIVGVLGGLFTSAYAAIVERTLEPQVRNQADISTGVPRG